MKHNIRISDTPTTSYCIYIAYVRSGLMSFPNVTEPQKLSNVLTKVCLEYTWVVLEIEWPGGDGMGWMLTTGLLKWQSYSEITDTDGPNLFSALHPKTKPV